MNNNKTETCNRKIVSISKLRLLALGNLCYRIRKRYGSVNIRLSPRESYDSYDKTTTASIFSITPIL